MNTTLTIRLTRGVVGIERLRMSTYGRLALLLQDRAESAQRAQLRRDGFAGLTAEDGATGTLTTKTIVMPGESLYVNVERRDGPGRVEVALLDERGAELPGYGMADCVPITCDAVRAPVTWNESSDTQRLAGRRVQIVLRVNGGAIVYAIALGKQG